MGAAARASYVRGRAGGRLCAAAGSGATHPSTSSPTNEQLCAVRQVADVLFLAGWAAMDGCWA